MGRRQEGLIPRAARLVPAALLALSALAGAQGLEATVELPSSLAVLGDDYVVTVRYEAGADLLLEPWRFGLACLDLDGKALGDRQGAPSVPLSAGSSVTLALNVGGFLERVGEFELGLPEAAAQKVAVVEAVPAELDFLAMSPEDLAKYRVAFITNRGAMTFEFFPDKAPGHVRNFLDLASSGFYDGIQFHRVSPNFMIQAGCPNTKTNQDVRTWGTGSGPRTLEAEFNDTKHVRGILSMARGTGKDSASSQFFVMTRRNGALDGQYTGFGRLLTGEETLTAISEAQGVMNPQDRTVRPAEPQRILRAIVLEK